MKKLSSTQLRKEVETLEAWKLHAGDTKISKTFLFPDFISALQFVNKVGKLAEIANHHPDIVLKYGKVKITLSTHSAGGLTGKDFALARDIN